MSAEQGREKAEEVLGVIQDVAADLLTSHGEQAVEEFWDRLDTHFVHRRSSRIIDAMVDDRLIAREFEEALPAFIEARKKNRESAQSFMQRVSTHNGWVSFFDRDLPELSRWLEDRLRRLASWSGTPFRDLNQDYVLNFLDRGTLPANLSWMIDRIYADHTPDERYFSVRVYLPHANGGGIECRLERNEYERRRLDADRRLG